MSKYIPELILFFTPWNINKIISRIRFVFMENFEEIHHQAITVIITGQGWIETDPEGRNRVRNQKRPECLVGQNTFEFIRPMFCFFILKQMTRINWCVHLMGTHGTLISAGTHCFPPMWLLRHKQATDMLDSTCSSRRSCDIYFPWYTLSVRLERTQQLSL